jgi:hypothetical protein
LERYFSIKYYKNKKQEKQQQQLFCLLGSLKMELPKKHIFLIFFKLGKLVEDYHLLHLSKPLEGVIVVYKILILEYGQMVTSEFFLEISRQILFLQSK